MTVARAKDWLRETIIINAVATGFLVVAGFCVSYVVGAEADYRYNVRPLMFAVPLVGLTVGLGKESRVCAFLLLAFGTILVFEFFFRHLWSAGLFAAILSNLYMQAFLATLAINRIAKTNGQTPIKSLHLDRNRPDEKDKANRLEKAVEDAYRSVSQ